MQRGTDQAAAIRQVNDDARQAVQQSLRKQEAACDEVKAELDSLQSTTANDDETNGKVKAACKAYPNSHGLTTRTFTGLIDMSFKEPCILRATCDASYSSLTVSNDYHLQVCDL